MNNVDLNFYNFVLQRLCSMLLLFLFSFSIIFVSFSLIVLWIMESSLDEVVFHTVTIYTNKIGDCLFIYLFVYLSICSAIGGQTARPNRLKFGG